MNRFVNFFCQSLVVLGWTSLPSLSFAADFAYDSLNRLTSITYDSGRQISYTYDAAGNRLTMVTSAPVPPNAFSFTATSNVGLSATVTSGYVTPAGFTNQPIISVSGGQYCISSTASCSCDVAAFTTNAGTLTLGQSVCARQISSATPNTTVTTTVNIGGVSGTFVSTTANVPDAPTIGVATTGDSQVTVAFTAPGYNGGSPITGYTATCGGQSASGATSPIAVTGLTNGTPVTCTVVATSAIGNSAASQASNSVTPVGLSAQTITFPAQTPASRPYSTTPFTINPLATGGTSGNPVTYSSTTPTVCTVSSTNVTIVAIGTCTIAADQAGNATYTAATQVTQNVTITQASQTLTFSPASSVTLGVAPIMLTATATSGLTSFTFSTSSAASICTVSGSTLTFVGPGTCALTASQAGNANYAAATANANVVIGASSYTVTPSASSNGSITPPSPQLVSAGSTATFTITANAGYLASVTGNCGGTMSGTSPNYSFTTSPINSNCSVVASFSNVAGPPTAPIIGTIVPSSGSATIYFSIPAANVGNATASYTATCTAGGFTATGPGSPLTVTGLSNGTSYSCSVVASNAAGSSPQSASVSVTPQPSPTISAIKSRKTHGAAGTFDLDITPNIPINGPITVEPRFPGGGHKLVFKFPTPALSVGAASVIDASGVLLGSAYAAIEGNDIGVLLVGIPDNQRVAVLVSGVNGSNAMSVSLGFLVGDVNSSGSVSAKDVSATKARIGQTLTQSNYRSDVNLSGTISQADLTATRARSGKVLP